MRYHGGIQIEAAIGKAACCGADTAAAERALVVHHIFRRRAEFLIAFDDLQGISQDEKTQHLTVLTQAKCMTHVGVLTASSAMLNSAIMQASAMHLKH